MKVLWFSPVAMPEVCQELRIKPSYGGTWIYPLLEELNNHKEVELSVAWFYKDCVKPRAFVRDRITYYILPSERFLFLNHSFLRKVAGTSQLLFSTPRERWATFQANKVIEKVRPDIIHAFGSEHFYGLVAPDAQVPVVVWIQGILDVYQRHYFGGTGLLERLRYPRLLVGYWQMRADAAREQSIFRSCRHFIGRTRWDASHQANLQPKGVYYFVQDCIRSEFLDSMAWCPENASGFTVYSTTSPALLKGSDVLLQAIGLLKKKCMAIKLRLAGTFDRSQGVTQRLYRVIRKLNLGDNVTFLGQLDAKDIVRELQEARVFVLPSFIENNPNSLAEAQLVGSPVVAAYVGGVPDMVKDGETGLLFQAGDYCTLAHQIDRLFDSDTLACSVGQRARQVARKRHDSKSIAKSLLCVYERVMKSTHNSAL